MSVDILPDSRTASRKGAVWVRTPVGGMWYVPIFCINCGKPYGMVPESHITHVTALCDHGCSGAYGDLAHHWLDQDSALRADTQEAVSGLLAKIGRPVTPEELDQMARDGHSALAAVYRDWQARVSKES